MDSTDPGGNNRDNDEVGKTQKHNTQNVKQKTPLSRRSSDTRKKRSKRKTRKALKKQEALRQKKVKIEPRPPPKEKTQEEVLQGHLDSLTLDVDELTARKRQVTLWRVHDPALISCDLQDCEEISSVPSLNNQINMNLLQNNINKLFPVQGAVIRWLLNRLTPEALVGGKRDLCVTSPSGSGKTLAYVLPIVHLLWNQCDTCIQVLVVVPTDDLAIQVQNVFKLFTEGSNLKTGLPCTEDTKIEDEREALLKTTEIGNVESKIDILVTTPRRLIEHIVTTEGFSLRYLKFLVIDEADTILEKTSNSWLNHLDNHVRNEGRQYLVPPNISEYYVIAEPHLKPLAIYDLIVDKKWEKVLIFTNSNEEAHHLTYLLRSLLPREKITELTSFQSLVERTDTLSLCEKGEYKILVTCDNIAKGIDFPGVKYVISYDPAKVFQTYAHRAGRIGREGEPGYYVTFLISSDQGEFFEFWMSSLNRVNVSKLSLNLSNYGEMLEKLEAVKYSSTEDEEEEEEVKTAEDEEFTEEDQEPSEENYIKEAQKEKSKRKWMPKKGSSEKKKKM